MLWQRSGYIWFESGRVGRTGTILGGLISTDTIDKVLTLLKQHGQQTTNLYIRSHKRNRSGKIVSR